jgi:hypothetical protein
VSWQPRRRRLVERGLDDMRLDAEFMHAGAHGLAVDGAKDPGEWSAARRGPDGPLPDEAWGARRGTATYYRSHWVDQFHASAASPPLPARPWLAIFGVMLWRTQRPDLRSCGSLFLSNAKRESRDAKPVARSSPKLTHDTGSTRAESAFPGKAA